jgi:hypothetical protein
MRAIATFTVAAKGIRLRVRLLPSISDVHVTCPGSRPRRDGLYTPAFFLPANPEAKHTGTVVFGLDGRLEELVPHEVSHAVVHHYKGVHVDDDERAATAIGLLTAAIHTRMRRLEVRP